MEVEPIERLDETLKEAGITSNQFTSFLAKNNMEMIKGVGVYDKLSGSILTQGQAVKLATIQHRRFKFEWLSIMFAGMALNRVFGGLVNAQMQLFGVTDLLSSAWTIVLLPIMELITPTIYKLLDAFMNLPEGVKLAIGGFVLFMASVGLIMLVLGQFMLFLGGLKILMPGVFLALKTIIVTIFTTIFGFLKGIVIGIIGIFKGISLGTAGVMGSFTSLFAVLAGFVSILAGVYLIVKGKFEGIGLIIMGVGAILLLFVGWWALIPIAVGAAVYLIIKHWDTIKSWFKGFVDWLGNIFSKSWDGIKFGFSKVGEFFKSIGEGIKNIFKGIVNSIISVINFLIKGMNKLKIKIPNWVPAIGGKSFGVNIPLIPYFEKGGIMPYTGLAYLHAGERVIPKGETETIIFSPTINLNAQVSSDYDVRKLAFELNKYWRSEFERTLKGRV